MSETEIAAPAATILLLRETPALEVLMVERHENVGFAGGAMVFPGGRVDPGDENPAWADFTTGGERDLFSRQVAAVREAFEEAGVLLAREKHVAPGGPMICGERTKALDPFRAEVEADDAMFLELIKRENLTLALDALTTFAHWVAPPRVHKRFDTHFFAVHCPPGQEAREDGNEATEAVWVRPQQALDERDAGRRKIIFPTVVNLHLLAAHDTAEAVLNDARQRPIVPVMPVIAERDGEPCLTIPEDLGYPFTCEPFSRSFNQ